MAVALQHDWRDEAPPAYVDGAPIGRASFWMEIEPVLGEAAKGFGDASDASVAATAPVMRVRGIASTDHVDLQGERILQEGLDWSYFLKWGWLNDIHDKSAGAGVGYPVSVRPVDLPDGHKGWAIEAILLSNQAGRRIWDTLLAIERDGAPRNIGFSVQGPILLRLDATGQPAKDGKTLARILVMDVTVTRHAVNKHAPLELALKSLDWAVKSLDAGHPAPSYDGGGEAAPLFPQSHDSRPKRRIAKRKKAMTKDEFAKRFGKTDRETQTLAAKALGVEWSQEDADGYGGVGPGAGGEAAKSLDEQGRELFEDVSQALKSIESHMEEGGEVLLTWPGQSDESTDEAVKGAFEGAKDAFGVVTKSLDTIASHQALLFETMAHGGEVQKSLDARMDVLQEQLTQLGAQPLRPKTLRPGAPVGKPADGGGDDPAKKLTYGVARKSLEAAWDRAEAEGNDKRQDQISPAMRNLDAGWRPTELDLKALAVDVLQ